MKRNFKFSGFFVIAILFCTAFFFTNISFSQTSTNLEKLQLTFPVNFTEKEKKFINSLSQTDLEKLIRVIKLIIERNITAQQSVATQDLRGAPTTYSNNSSAQTPYYNPQTGQYQSTPISGGSSGNPGINNNVSGGQQNPFSNNLPFSGQPTGGQQTPFPQQLPQPQSPAAALIQGLNQGLQNSDINTSVAENTPNGTCPNSTGVQWSGQSSCPRDIGPNPNMRKAIMEACQKIQKPLKSQSIYRPPSCNGRAGGATNSNHLTGRAMDLHLDNLNSNEKIIVFQVFKANGFTGYGCYGNRNYIHLSISNTERYGSGCPPELKLSGYAR